MALYYRKRNPPSTRIILPVLILLTCLSAITLSGLYYIRHARESFIIQEDDFWKIKQVEYDLNELKQSSGFVGSVGSSNTSSTNTDNDPLAGYLPPQDTSDLTVLSYLTGIAVTSCVIPASVTSLISPLSALCPSPSGSGWKKIPKDINHGIGWGTVWVWFKEEDWNDLSSTNQERKIIERVLLVEGEGHMDNDDLIVAGQEWVKVSTSLRSYLPKPFKKLPDINIFYLLSPPPSSQYPYRPITSLDILYGDLEVTPPFGWYDVGKVHGGSITKVGTITDGTIGAKPQGNGARLIFQSGYEGTLG
jgi:hypothetical protein